MVLLEKATQHRETKGRTTLGLDSSPTPTVIPTPAGGWSYSYYIFSASHAHAIATIMYDAVMDNFQLVYSHAGTAQD
jgi:hypothetical protein